MTRTMLATAYPLTSGCMSSMKELFNTAVADFEFARFPGGTLLPVQVAITY